MFNKIKFGHGKVTPPHLEHGSLGQLELHIPNGIRIDSAVFAVLTTMIDKTVTDHATLSAATGHIYVLTATLQMFPGQSLSRTDVSRTRYAKDFHVHNVCKYQLYRPSHTICRYKEHPLMCACRPAVSIRGPSVKRKLCCY